MELKSETLILFENDLHVPTLKNILGNYKSVFIILLGNAQRKIKLSEAVLKFKQQMVFENFRRFAGEKRYCFPFVCNPATHLQLKRLEAASPS
jgi:hypothetical protein